MAVERSDVSKKIVEELRNAGKYAEGRGLRIEIKSRDDVKNIKKLVAIKINI